MHERVKIKLLDAFGFFKVTYLFCVNYFTGLWLFPIDCSEGTLIDCRWHIL